MTAGDFVREFKELCNPASPTGAPGYYTSTIVGMKAYCAAFSKVKPDAAAIAGYANGHALAGVSAPNDSTLVFHLVNPAPDFNNILAMPFSSARPVEYDQYVPDSAQWRQHTLSDGPYEITKYVATKEFVLKRNPAWNQAIGSAPPRVRRRDGRDGRADGGQRPAADRGRHRRHGLGRHAAGAGPAEAGGGEGHAARDRAVGARTTSRSTPTWR